MKRRFRCPLHLPKKRRFRYEDPKWVIVLWSWYCIRYKTRSGTKSYVLFFIKIFLVCLKNYTKFQNKMKIKKIDIEQNFGKIYLVTTCVV